MFPGPSPPSRPCNRLPVAAGCLFVHWVRIFFFFSLCLGQLRLRLPAVPHRLSTARRAGYPSRTCPVSSQLLPAIVVARILRTLLRRPRPTSKQLGHCSWYIGWPANSKAGRYRACLSAVSCLTLPADATLPAQYQPVPARNAAPALNPVAGSKLFPPAQPQPKPKPPHFWHTCFPAPVAPVTKFPPPLLLACSSLLSPSPAHRHLCLLPPSFSSSSSLSPSCPGIFPPNNLFFFAFFFVARKLDSRLSLALDLLFVFPVKTFSLLPSLGLSALSRSSPQTLSTVLLTLLTLDSHVSLQKPAKLASQLRRLWPVPKTRFPSHTHKGATFTASATRTD